MYSNFFFLLVVRINPDLHFQWLFSFFQVWGDEVELILPVSIKFLCVSWHSLAYISNHFTSAFPSNHFSQTHLTFILFLSKTPWSDTICFWTTKLSTWSWAVLIGSRNGTSLPFLMRYGTLFPRRYSPTSCSSTWITIAIWSDWRRKGWKLSASKSESFDSPFCLSRVGRRNDLFSSSCFSSSSALPCFLS